MYQIGAADKTTSKGLAETDFSYQIKCESYKVPFLDEIDTYQAKYNANDPRPISDFANVVPHAATEILQEAMARIAPISGVGGPWGLVEGLLNVLTFGESRKLLLSPEFGRILDAVDGLFAGWAHSLTGGLSTKLRGALWGEAATRNHTGDWFELGTTIGGIHTMAMMGGNPCAMGRVLGISLRVLNGMEALGSAASAYENFSQGNIGAGMVDLLSAGGHLFTMFRACFTGDTEVLTRRGFVRFDQLRDDDEVAASPEHNPHGPVEFKPIEALFVNHLPIWHLHVNGKVIRTTEEHPFYVWGKGWVACRALEPGDVLRSHDGQFIAVEVTANLHLMDSCPMLDGGAK